MLESLPPRTRQVLLDVVEAARAALGGELRSVVLFGSAAEGRLRATSDVNVLFLLTRFDAAQIAGLRPALTQAEAAIDLQPMFLVEEELPAAAELFAVKFGDILRRHAVLYGAPLPEDLKISRAAELSRLKQVLLNLVLRLRQSFASRGNQEETLAAVLADAAGPVRVAARTLLQLEGAATTSPKEALARVAKELGAEGLLLDTLSEAREQGQLAAGRASAALPSLLALLDGLRTRAGRL